MKKLIAPLIFISILLFAEIISYIAIRNFFLISRPQLRTFNWIWWSSTILLYAAVIVSRMSSHNFTKNLMVNIFVILLITKLVAGLAFIITKLVQLIGNLRTTTPAEEINPGRRIFASKLALGVAAIPLGVMAWGIVRTAYDFKIHRPKIKFPNLPQAFNGLKIVQISDIHTGSLQGNHQLQKAIDLIHEQKPDLIVFTGDLVNNRTDEAYPYIPILSQLSAPMGVYSILGNHDYGDYESWPSDAAKKENLQEMIDLHRKLGWKLLMNEHVIFEKEGSQMALLGVENWGANLNFKKYGKLAEAYKDTEAIPFKLLLSHDPSHFSAEVITDYKDIDLTLSGHTHGFQFGIEIPGFKWSPSQYIYKQWAGLYSDAKQKIYVNRGLGCLGYMGRVGIRPEITVLELFSDLQEA